MLSRIAEWVNYRWPFSPLTRLMLDEEIPGGSRFAYTLGSALLIVFALQAVSGIMQLFFYVPAEDYAYDSISYLRTKVPFGWLMHGIHYWGANAMVLLVVLHMSRVFVWGAYKRPRELTWLAGVALLLTVMGFSFTGGPLHWDQRGYWAGEVGTSIAGTAPVVGDMMKHLLRGGEEMGQLTLSRFFIVHTAILPGALVGLFVFHIIAMRRFGAVGPWDESKGKTSGPFWPDQVFKDAVTGTAVFLLIIWLTVFLPPSYSGPADTLDTSYIPKPEWNFLFLYEALKYFQGILEPVGTVGVPTALVMLLMLLPFIDRGPERNPFRRPIAMACALALAGVLSWLTVSGYLSTGFARSDEPQKKETSYNIQPAPGRMNAVPNAAAGTAVGLSLFAGLSHAAEAPASGGISRPAGETTVTLRGQGSTGKAAYIIGSAERGADLFKRHCAQCHGPAGFSKAPNPGSLKGKIPDLNPIGREFYDSNADIFAENIDRYIQNGSIPEGPKPAIRMPAFGQTNSLTQQQISNIEAYILGLNGVDRAQIVNPGMRPRTFFAALVAAYAAVLLLAGGLWKRKRPS